MLVLNLLWQVVYATTSFLSDTLVTKGQIQNVLEHHPAKHSGCKNTKVYPLKPDINIILTARSQLVP